jgi:stringent starvation protein B
VKPRRPYLLRALHEWISDCAQTPHIVVDAAAAGVQVPRQYVKDGKIVLNVSHNAANRLRLGNEAVSFEARFGGVNFSVDVPVRAVLGIYARETGQGMIFPEGDADPDPSAPDPAPPAPVTKKRPSLKVVK